MKVLVTGGTGFLGRHTAARLLQEGYSVQIAGRNFEKARTLIERGAQPVSLDLRGPEGVVAACAGVDAVVHAGALSAPWGPRAEFMAANLGGTQAVIEGCRRHKVPRLVHISSPSVIFDGRDHFNITEAHPYPRRFMSVYALTKKLAEEAVNASGLNTVTLRPKAIFGPGDTALLPRLIAAARAGRLRIFGDGHNRVDLTYVDNVVEAIRLALERETVTGTYTITNDEHVPLWDTVRAVLDRVGLPSTLRRVPLPAGLAAAQLMEWWGAATGKEPLLTRYSVALLARTQTYDITAAKTKLGYRPIVPVAEAVERTLRELPGHGLPRPDRASIA